MIYPFLEYVLLPLWQHLSVRNTTYSVTRASLDPCVLQVHDAKRPTEKSDRDGLGEPFDSDVTMMP
jgi:hypothetical protein